MPLDLARAIKPCQSTWRESISMTCPMDIFHLMWKTSGESDVMALYPKSRGIVYASYFWRFQLMKFGRFIWLHQYIPIRTLQLNV